MNTKIAAPRHAKPRGLGADFGKLIRLGKKHGLFLLAIGSRVDFIDKANGNVLAVWNERPYPHFLHNDVRRAGTALDAMRAIVDPYDL